MRDQEMMRAEERQRQAELRQKENDAWERAAQRRRDREKREAEESDRSYDAVPSRPPPPTPHPPVRFTVDSWQKHSVHSTSEFSFD